MNRDVVDVSDSVWFPSGGCETGLLLMLLTMFVGRQVGADDAAADAESPGLHGPHPQDPAQHGGLPEAAELPPHLRRPAVRRAAAAGLA